MKKRENKYGCTQYLNGIVVRTPNKRQVITYDEEHKTYQVDFYRTIPADAKEVTEVLPFRRVLRNKIVIHTVWLSPEGLETLFGGLYHIQKMNLHGGTITYTYDAEQKG